MCGIAGVFAYRGGGRVDRDLLVRMTNALAHRGPDGWGVSIDEGGTVGLGHRRLSIIDLEMGQQPMWTEDRSLGIVFNGEIYNFLELRRELESKGHRFVTRSDTEVILELYRAEGPEGIARLNGIFAFAVWDVRRHRLLLARDHLGVKPLYWMDTGDTLLFASEIKSILLHPSATREVDLSGLQTFLTLRYNPAPGTLLCNVQKLRPGEMLLADDSGIQTRRFFTDTPDAAPAGSLEDIAEEYLERLETAVSRQMLSDVPVGLLLSGGVDSAIIGHYMAHHVDGPIKTFSVGFEGSGDFNELDDAAATARFLGSDHHALVLKLDSYLEFLAQGIWHIEEPVGEPTVAAYYHVCRLASQHVKVVLTGQGADELLGGYDRYFPERYRAALGWLARLPGSAEIVGALPASERLAWAVRAMRPADPLARFFEIYTLFSAEQQRALWKAEYHEQLQANARNAHAEIETLQRRVANVDSLRQILYLDTRTSLPDDLLLFGDKLAMAVGLEARVPFLDLDLVRFVESLPASVKIRRLRRKFVHKRALAHVLPAEILRRKKRGFPTPFRRWLRGSEQERFRRLLLAPEAGIARYFRTDTIRGLLDEHAAGRRDHWRRLFALINLELWYQRFIMNQEPAV
ncbi:MAG: asparagine synthase (glutamine-hydrolyzing) [Gemmatimonadaceae bacterium]